MKQGSRPSAVIGRGDDASKHNSDKPLLQVDSVEASYGPYKALFGVSFSVAEGSAMALLGSNGAGKSTVSRVVSGLIPATSGRVIFAGQDVTGLSAWRIARLGLAHAPEGRSVFASLTVLENLQLTFRRSLGKEAVGDALAAAFSEFPRLRERQSQLAGTLSGGEQRMLALAKVLAVPPRLLIVDELSLGLAPIIADEVFERLDAIRSRGTSLLIVEQHVGRALELADRVVLLFKGQVSYEGPVSELGDLAHQVLPTQGSPAAGAQDT
ncbi:MAG: ABC transporter ATP-binding protein [Acidimicrobiales bacterium]